MNIIKRVDQVINKVAGSIVIMEDEIENRVPMHHHTKGHILIVEGGLAYLKTGEKQYYIPAKHFIWIPSYVDHFVKFQTSSVLLRTIYFYDDHQYSDFFDQLGIYPMNGLLSEMIKLAESWHGIFTSPSWEFEFLMTLKHLLPNQQLKPFSIQLPASDNKIINEIHQYLRDNLSEPITQKIIADKFGLSLRSLARLFKNELKTSFLQYLKMVRIIRAMELLLFTDKRISEVTYETGYSSIAAFSNTFADLVNMRPSLFRQLNEV